MYLIHEKENSLIYKRLISINKKTENKDHMEHACRGLEQVVQRKRNSSDSKHD